jgi:hypothetical protein
MRRSVRFRVRRRRHVLGGRISRLAVGRARPGRAVRSTRSPAASESGGLFTTQSETAGLNALARGEDAAIWAHRSLGEKNRLMAPDAQRVEEAFQAKLGTFAASPRTEDSRTRPERPTAARRSARERNAGKTRTRQGTEAIDKSVPRLDRSHAGFMTATA